MTTVPRHDPPVPITPELGSPFVLIQTAPRIEVLATSHDDRLLRAEAMRLAKLQGDARKKLTACWFVRRAAMHLT